MSASHRKLARLPLHIFEGVIVVVDDDDDPDDDRLPVLRRRCDPNNDKNNATTRSTSTSTSTSQSTSKCTSTSTSTTTPEEELRAKICFRLKRFPVKSRAGVSKGVSIKTVGDLLRASKRTLLQALDPIFTYGKKCNHDDEKLSMIGVLVPVPVPVPVPGSVQYSMLFIMVVLSHMSRFR
jgi:hypothetical protein